MGGVIEMNLLLAIIIVISPFVLVGWLAWLKYKCNHKWEVVKEGEFEILLKCSECGKLHKEWLIRRGDET